MPLQDRDDVASSPSGSPIRTAMHVPITEIWMVSTVGRASCRRKSQVSFGGNPPRRKRATLPIASPSTSFRGSAWLTYSEPARTARKPAVRSNGKVGLLAESGKRPAGVPVGISGAIVAPLELERVVPVTSIEPLEQLVGHLVGSEVEVNPAVPDADDAREVRQGK